MDKLCKIRDLQRAVHQFESAFEKRYGICLNVLRSVEQKGLVTRELCNEDRRQMYYSLTQQGRELLASVSCREVETPEILRDWLCG